MDRIVDALQSILFVTSTFPYGVIWVLVWGIALSFYLFRRRAFGGKVAKITFWTFFLCSPLFLASINVSKIKAEYEFRKACAEDSGLFVYRKVSLGPEYWLPIDPVTGPVNDEIWYVLNTDIELNKAVIDRDFKIDYSSRRLRSGMIAKSVRLTDIRSSEVLSEFKGYSAALSYFLSQKDRTCVNLGYKGKPHASASHMFLEIMKNTFIQG
jgi:hypothetical protein